MNTSCGVHTLRRLADDESATVRASVAANPALDAATLQQLTLDPAAKVRAGALTHPGCPPDALTAAASTYHRTARLLALDHPNFPPEALTAAATHSNPKVRHRALSRPDCPPEAITAAIAAHRDEPTAQIAVSHPQCPPNAMRSIVEAALAAGDGYDPEFGRDDHLYHLHPQAHPMHTGRSGRALPAAAAALDLLDGPAELFTAAARSNNYWLSVAALTNPSCPPEVLTAAARSSPPDRYALTNPSCPSETLTSVLDTYIQPPDYGTSWRVCIAANPNCPPDRLIELCNDASPFVARAALVNPSLPKPALLAAIETLLR